MRCSNFVFFQIATMLRFGLVFASWLVFHNSILLMSHSIAAIFTDKLYLAFLYEGANNQSLVLKVDLKRELDVQPTICNERHRQRHQIEQILLVK